VTLTIFTATYNRLETLERTLRSFRNLRTPHEVCIVDNGTDDPACIRFLDQLEKKVKKVYRLPRCIHMDEVQANYDIALRDQYETGDAEWFAVNDCDVCFEGSHPKTLDAYIRLAKETGRSVGPHLRVDGAIPVGYPLRSRVLACETWMLYRSDMEWLDDIPFSSVQIDTTFHLFTPRRSFDRLHMDPYRVGPPYDAMHLDWYIDVTQPAREDRLLIPNERPMGSWGKKWISAYWSDFQVNPEFAFERLMAEPTDPHHDLCNVSFTRAWAYQYGHGVQANREASEEHLAAAIPYPNERYWLRAGDWSRMIYNNNFSALGWAA